MMVADESPVGKADTLLMHTFSLMLEQKWILTAFRSPRMTALSQMLTWQSM
jgi:hypothetical protein